MRRVMIFIDGTWLYYSKSKLAESGREEFSLDYGKLPAVLGNQLAQALGETAVDIVRTHLFGSYAANYAAEDEDAAQRQRDFFNMLKERYHYEVEVFPIDFKQRRLRRADREPDDNFEPREKCVDVALASTLMYYAAVPGAYDVAIVVVGDEDFVPLLQDVRRLGKRVLIATIRNCCCRDFADPCDEARLKDFSTVWLDDLLDDLELTYTRQKLRCESPLHQGNPMVWTTYVPARNEHFYCEECRALYAQQKREGGHEPGLAPAPVAAVAAPAAVPPPVGADSPLPAASVAPAEVPAVEAPRPLPPPASRPVLRSAGDRPRAAAEPAEPRDPRDPRRTPPPSPPSDEPALAGHVKAKFDDRGYGFIHGNNGSDYFFHLSDLDGLIFEALEIGQPVSFHVRKEPVGEKAGAAMRVAVPAGEAAGADEFFAGEDQDILDPQDERVKAVC